MEFIERALDAVENAGALDGIARAVSKVVRPVVTAAPVHGLLSGTPIGHAAHPMLVPVPLGCFLSSILLDVTGGDRDAARRLVGVGVLATVPTAAAGLSDWVDTTGAERRVGLIHLAANVAALAAFSTSWWQRRRGGGRAVGLLGGALLGAGGYLGGHLSYAQGVGVDTTSFAAGPQEWTPVAAADELKRDELRQVRADGVALLLVRRATGVVAMADRCTHRGAPLSEGSVVGDCVECPWHGSRFRLSDGGLQRGPASRPQPVYEVRERAGQVEVRRQEPRSLRTNPV